MKMMYSLQINMIVKCGATGIGLLGGGRIEGESVVVNGPTSLNFGNGDCFFIIRRCFGDFRSLVLVKNAGKNGAESTKYWSNSSKSYAQSDREVSEYYDEVCTGRENRHFSGRIESVYEKALYLSWSHQ